MEENKAQRIRRTRTEMKTDVLNAVSQLSKEKQLSLITMVDVSKCSGIRVDVLQRNYATIEKVLSLYASSVDYWISDLFNAKHPMDSTTEEQIRELFANLINALYNDSEMQRLLVWELAEDNPTTRRLATSREQFYAEVFAGYKHLFEGTGLHIDIISALINAGIYYLILHRKRSTFWGVDFYKRSERKRFLEATDQLLTLIFSALKERNNTLCIARRMKENGIDNEMIAKCTGLTANELQVL